MTAAPSTEVLQDRRQQLADELAITTVACVFVGSFAFVAQNPMAVGGMLALLWVISRNGVEFMTVRRLLRDREGRS